MGIVERGVINGIQKAVALYLPATRTLVIKASDRRGATALRVWLDETAAREYFVLDGRWWSAGPADRADTGIRNGTGAQLISARIAKDIAEINRRLLHPLRSDPTVVSKTESADRECAGKRLGECLNFLEALASRAFPLTDSADTYASGIISELTQQIKKSEEEATARLTEPSRLSSPQMVKLLQQYLTHYLPGVETKLVSVKSRGVLALSLPNIDEVESWFAFDGKNWIDDEGFYENSLSPEDDEAPESNYTVSEMVLEVANKVLSKVAKEFSEPEPIQHDELFAEVVMWMIKVRDMEVLPEMAPTARFYLRSAMNSIKTRQALAGLITRPTRGPSARPGEPGLPS